MPKKRRSDGRGNVHPTDMPDRFKAKCKKCGAVIAAATKKDMELAKEMHLLMVH